MFHITESKIPGITPSSGSDGRLIVIVDSTCYFKGVGSGDSEYALVKCSVCACLWTRSVFVWVAFLTNQNVHWQSWNVEIQRVDVC